MRTEIVHIGAGELNYEIRNIMRVVDQLRTLGLNINLENIGDPVAKGEKVPLWMKEIVSRASMDDCAYSYCPSQGVLETREYLAERNNRLGGARISANDIIFFNGLGDAIAKVYGFLRRTARIIAPSPTYTTHSASEAAHAGVPPVTYPLDPENFWYPDTAELRKRVKYNPAVAGILLINPDNPTGAVYPEEILREIVRIAEDYDLFIIADEIYQNLVYDGVQTRTLAEVIGSVPGIAMKGISKELPWPGSRCGWIELYNRERDRDFKTYTQSILNSKMVEVCSTTLPQKVIPQIFEHPEHESFLQRRRARYRRLSERAYNILKENASILINRTNGAFYMSAIFREGALKQDQALPIEDNQIRSFIESLLRSNGSISPDKRFVYYLLAATGVCVVPLSSFNTDLQGFRFTLLDPNEASFAQMVNALSEGITAYT